MTLSTTRTDDLLADGAAQATALVDGYQVAYYVAAGLLVAAIALAALLLRSRPATAAGPTAEVEPELAAVAEVDADREKVLV